MTTPAVADPAPAAPAEASPLAMRFDVTELSGSLGDLGTFLPLAVGVAAVCGMDLGIILVWAGVLHVATGLAFRLPMPVQPMKAIAAVAIAEALAPAEIAAAGMLMGAAMAALALSGVVGAVVRLVPRPVVRGIQAGVAAKLALTGASWLAGLPPVGYDSLLVASAAGAALLLAGRGRVPALLLLFAAGFVLLAAQDPALFASLSLGPPVPTLILPDAAAWGTGLVSLTIPQLPLTLLNSVVAVCALSEDLFPGRGASPRRVAASVGLMNALTAPLGGLPLCHGAGGLAAHYRFGARTGGSVVMLGAMMAAAGLAFGDALLPLLQAYPRSVLAAMLLGAAWTLALPARDSLRGRPLMVVAITVAGILSLGTAWGAALGVAAAALVRPTRRGTA